MKRLPCWQYRDGHWRAGHLHSEQGGVHRHPALLAASNSVVIVHAVMDIDTLGTFTMSKAAFPALKAVKSSCIINISMTLHYGATWYQTHASAAKVNAPDIYCSRRTVAVSIHIILSEHNPHAMAFHASQPVRAVISTWYQTHASAAKVCLHENP